jgi:hypothetical protein
MLELSPPPHIQLIYTPVSLSLLSCFTLCWQVELAYLSYQVGGVRDFQRRHNASFYPLFIGRFFRMFTPSPSPLDLKCKVVKFHMVVKSMEP